MTGHPPDTVIVGGGSAGCVLASRLSEDRHRIDTGLVDTSRPCLPRRIAVVADLPVGQRLRDQPMYALTYVLKADAGAGPPNGSGVLWTAVVTPRSTGTLRLKNLDPHVNSRIDYGLLTEFTDERRLREIVGLGRRVMRLEPVANLVAAEFAPGPDAASDDELKAAIRAGLITFYHGTSSVPTGGPDDPAAVVDGADTVRGLTGLRVVDASIMPEPVSVPVNLTTILLAERIAGWMRATPTDPAVRAREGFTREAFRPLTSKGEWPNHRPR